LEQKNLYTVHCLQSAFTMLFIKLIFSYHGVITHQKQQISKRWYCSAEHWHLGKMSCCVISLFWYLLFLKC